MVMLFLRLLIAHIFADFYLQTERMCEEKLNLCSWKGWRMQMLHALIHALFTYVLVMDWINWFIPLVVLVSHLVIDILKVFFLLKGQYLTNVVRSNWECVLFFVDQALHVLILWLLVKNVNIADNAAICSILNTKYLSYVVAGLIALKPTSIFIGKFTSRWNNEFSMTKGLLDAGKWIGYAERVLVLIFMFLETYEALGFLIAAKSLLRFQETDTKRTEYVLIGTLLSFGVAVILGVIIKYIGNF